MAPNSSRNGKDQRKEGDDAVTSTEYVTLNERSKDDYFLLAFGEKEDPDVTACDLDAEEESSSMESCDEELDSLSFLGSDDGEDLSEGEQPRAKFENGLNGTYSMPVMARAFNWFDSRVEDESKEAMNDLPVARWEENKIKGVYRCVSGEGGTNANPRTVAEL